LAADPEDFKKRVNAIKTFQTMVNFGEAIKSYEEFEDDFAELTPVVETIVDNVGHIENEKAAVKEYLEGLDGDGIGDDEINDLLQIDFSSDQRATHEEKIDSYYISQLLKDIKNEGSRQKFDEIIKNKSLIVQQAYDEALGGLDGEQEIVASVDSYFRRTIDSIVMEAAAILQVPENDLHISLNEYSKDKGEVPYINVIVEKSALTKEAFEQSFNKKYRERRRTIEEYWKNIIEVKLLPLREELVNI
jgi:type I restriction enzyme R subunit